MSKNISVQNPPLNMMGKIFLVLSILLLMAIFSQLFRANFSEFTAIIVTFLVGAIVSFFLGVWWLLASHGPPSDKPAGWYDVGG